MFLQTGLRLPIRRFSNNASESLVLACRLRINHGNNCARVSRRRRGREKKPERTRAYLKPKSIV